VRTLDLPADPLRERDQPKDEMRDPLPRRRRSRILLYTEVPSRLMRAELRRSGAKGVSISSTMAELIYGARLRRRVRQSSRPSAQFSRGLKQPLRHARIRVGAKRLGRSAGKPFDVMIAAHAEALGAILVTSDAAVKNLKITSLKIVSW
jgi:predicted nucleic acid-binding protein